MSFFKLLFNKKDTATINNIKNLTVETRLFVTIGTGTMTVNQIDC